MDVSIKMLLKAQVATQHETPYYIWRTAGDGKVRPSHAANEGRVFAWDRPPETGNPGDAPNCRCWAEPYYGASPEPGLESSILDVFLLALILTLLIRTPALAALWRAWTLQRAASKVWQLSKNKSPEKWANQLEKGNWTPEKITEVIRRGKPHKAINKQTKAPATRYQLGDRFVVRDNKTGDILQVSRPGMKPEVFE